MGNYDSIDSDWTWDGDYVVGVDGDLGDTSSDYILSMIHEIQTVAKGEFGDWEKHPNIGAGLGDFKGEPNTRETGKAIEQRLRSKLISSGIVRGEDLAVRVVPVSAHQIMCAVKVSATATPNNSLQLGTPIVVTLVYDTMEHDILFITPNAKDREVFR